MKLLVYPWNMYCHHLCGYGLNDEKSIWGDPSIYDDSLFICLTLPDMVHMNNLHDSSLIIVLPGGYRNTLMIAPELDRLPVAIKHWNEMSFVFNPSYAVHILFSGSVYWHYASIIGILSIYTHRISSRTNDRVRQNINVMHWQMYRNAIVWHV